MRSRPSPSWASCFLLTLGSSRQEPRARRAAQRKSSDGLSAHARRRKLDPRSWVWHGPRPPSSQSTGAHEPKFGFSSGAGRETVKGLSKSGPSVRGGWLRCRSLACLPSSPSLSQGLFSRPSRPSLDTRRRPPPSTGTCSHLPLPFDSSPTRSSPRSTHRARCRISRRRSPRRTSRSKASRTSSSLARRPMARISTAGAQSSSSRGPSARTPPDNLASLAPSGHSLKGRHVQMSAWNVPVDAAATKPSSSRREADFRLALAHPPWTVP